MNNEGRVQWISILLLGLITASLASDDWIRRSDLMESHWLRTYLGATEYHKIERDISAAIDAGQVSFSDLTSINDPYKPHLTSQMNDFVIWLQSRAELTEKLITRVLRRLLVLLIFSPLILVGLTLFAMDAVMTRQIRQHGFEYSSPLVHRTSYQALGFLTVALIVILMIPVPLPPQWMSVHFVLVAWSLWLNISHMPKRL